MTLPTAGVEPIIEPELPIVDAHHHLWLRSRGFLDFLQQQTQAPNSIGHVLLDVPRYLFDELLADVQSGHNVRSTVLVEAFAMYRASGPDHLKTVGEVEFANGVAAMSASGEFGDVRLCAGIVGRIDLRGDTVEEVLNAHISAGGGRYRGVRHGVASDSDSEIKKHGAQYPAGLLYDPNYRKGLKVAHRFGLSFDVWVLEPQLPELIDLARALPEVSIILNHLGTPLGIGGYQGLLNDRFPIWRENIRTLATCANVVVKLGGLGLPMTGTHWYRSNPSATSAQLATEWKPYIETCIDAFGPNRCMFESDYPVDSGSCTYPILWNAFKRITAGASRDEKLSLYSGTAARVYRLNI